MRIKTSRDIATSLQGSAFRRRTLDQRVRFVRRIRTLSELSSQTGRGVRR